jgi:hypothetical protein
MTEPCTVLRGNIEGRAVDDARVRALPVASCVLLSPV